MPRGTATRWTLPPLRLGRHREEGQVRERRAALPLPRLRQDVLRLPPDPRHEQAATRDLDGLRRVLRPHAPSPRVRRPLRCLPQDRLHHAPQAHRVPEGVFPEFHVGQGRACELDETYFPESFKGNHSKGSFTLPRKPRHRGKQVHKRGLSREQICVMTGVSDTNATFFEVSGRARGPRKRAAGGTSRPYRRVRNRRHGQGDRVCRRAARPEGRLA